MKKPSISDFVMLLPYRSARLRMRAIFFGLVFVAFVWFLLMRRQLSHGTTQDATTIATKFPLAWKHLQENGGTGGAWYIPPSWSTPSHSSKQPKSVLDAAHIASEAALSDDSRKISYSNIPLIVHQTWKHTRLLEGWKEEILAWVEKWLGYSIAGNPPMAYLFWDDAGIMEFMTEYYEEFLADFKQYFTPVERTDVFRVLVCRKFGGIYADVDTEPLQHPAKWIRQSDLAAWTDAVSGTTYGRNTSASNPVNFLWGIEADTEPESDTYWRMGYTYPIQLTQWALASAPDHPVHARFMDNLKKMLLEEKRPATPGVKKHKTDTIERTGPAAVTKATMEWLKDHNGLRWNSLTGLHDGGKSKLVADVLTLPITGFSPGRGRYGNMGSKPVTDPDARLSHHSQASWRKFDLKVEFGKFCRTMFGLCKDWSKVPGG